MVCPAPKSIPGIRPTYGENTGILGKHIIGRVRSCLWKYVAMVDPANEGGIRVYRFWGVQPRKVIKKWGL
jgi:hypothetical protein